jgi:hypothetical protein
MGRIRTLKPEWLEDEKLAACDDDARVLSAGLILLADDQGRGRASPAYLASQVWTYQPSEAIAKAARGLSKLAEIKFVILYNVNGEQLFQIRNWEKHQKISHPAQPRLPAPIDDQLVVVEPAKPRSPAPPKAETPSSDTPAELPGVPPAEKPNLPAVKSLPKHPKSSRRCPADFELTPTRQGVAVSIGVKPQDVASVFASFKDQEFKVPHSDWEATWRQWCRNELKYLHGGGSRSKSTSETNQQNILAALANAAAREEQ